MLKSNLIDLAIVTSPIEQFQEISQQTLKTFSEVAICGEAFQELSLRTPLSWKELSQYPIISLGSHTATYEFYFTQFMKEQLPFHADIEAATADQILPLVQHNMGIGFVPEEFLDDASGKIFKIPLANQLPKREICLIKQKKHRLPPPAAELERMMKL